MGILVFCIVIILSENQSAKLVSIGVDSERIQIDTIVNKRGDFLLSEKGGMKTLVQCLYRSRQEWMYFKRYSICTTRKEKESFTKKLLNFINFFLFLKVTKIAALKKTRIFRMNHQICKISCLKKNK